MVQPWMDAHCHLTARFHPALPQVLQELQEAGCHGFVLGGVDPLDWQEQLAIPSSPILMMRAFGLHPWTVQERDDEALGHDWITLERSLPTADALGECGLDYFRCKDDQARRKQIHWFDQQLALAATQQKPCILHIVRAHHEALRMMKAYRGKISGMVHSFWANRQTAQSWLDLGFYLSLAPRILTRDDHGLLGFVPADRLLFESDSPELRADGSVTDPRLALAIMEHAAQVLGIPVDTIVRQQNTKLRQLFARLSAAV